MSFLDDLVEVDSSFSGPSLTTRFLVSEGQVNHTLLKKRDALPHHYQWDDVARALNVCNARFDVYHTKSGLPFLRLVSEDGKFIEKPHFVDWTTTSWSEMQGKVYDLRNGNNSGDNTILLDTRLTTGLPASLAAQKLSSEFVWFAPHRDYTIMDGNLGNHCSRLRITKEMDWYENGRWYITAVVSYILAAKSNIVRTLGINYIFHRADGNSFQHSVADLLQEGRSHGAFYLDDTGLRRSCGVHITRLDTNLCQSLPYISDFDDSGLKLASSFGMPVPAGGYLQHLLGSLLSSLQVHPIDHSATLQAFVSELQKEHPSANNLMSGKFIVFEK